MDRDGWLNRAEMIAAGKPFFNPVLKKWMGSFSDMHILMSRSRCKEIGMPVKPGEEAVAYRLINSASGSRRWMPLYDRTAAAPAPLAIEIYHPDLKTRIEKEFDMRMASDDELLTIVYHESEASMQIRQAAADEYWRRHRERQIQMRDC